MSLWSSYSTIFPRSPRIHCIFKALLANRGCAVKELWHKVFYIFIFFFFGLLYLSFQTGSTYCLLCTCVASQFLGYFFPSYLSKNLDKLFCLLGGFPSHRLLKCPHSAWAEVTLSLFTGSMFQLHFHTSTEAGGSSNGRSEDYTAMHGSTMHFLGTVTQVVCFATQSRGFRIESSSHKFCPSFYSLWP